MRARFHSDRAQLLKAVFGSVNTWQVLIAVFALISLGWAADSLYDVLKHHAISMFGVDFPFVGIPFWILLALGLWRLRRPNYAWIDEHSQVRRRKVLILFLSPIGKLDGRHLLNGESDSTDVELPAIGDDHWLTQLSRVKSLDIESRADRRKFIGPWELSVEAIATHLPTLKRIIVLPSADSQIAGAHTGDSPVRRPGTHAQASYFQQMVLHLLEPRHRHVEVKIAAEGVGVDYERAADISRSINTLFEEQKKDGFRDTDIIVDLTAGQKPCTFAAAHASLADGRDVQYCSMHDKQVRSYELCYLKENDG